MAVPIHLQSIIIYPKSGIGRPYADRYKYTNRNNMLYIDLFRFISTATDWYYDEYLASLLFTNDRTTVEDRKYNTAPREHYGQEPDEVSAVIATA